MNAEEFECVIHNLPGVVFRCLPDAEWTLCFVSKGITELTGYPAEDFHYNTRRSLPGIIHPDDWEPASQRILASIRQQLPFAEELRIKGAGGMVRWVYAKGQAVCDTDGTVLFVDAALIDITARKLAEEALEREKENIRNVLANIPGIVYRTALGDTWTIEFISEGVQELFGVAPEKLIGRGLEIYGSFVHPDDIERVSSVIVGAGSKGEAYEVRYRVRDKEGNYREVYEKGQSCSRATDGRRYLDGVILDISRIGLSEA